MIEKPNVPCIRVEDGSSDDYRALSMFHYIGGRPARPAKTLRAIDEISGERAGVLVVAMPTLNGAGGAGGLREQAWPGRYRTGDKKLDAERINLELRTIARVVVDPRFRACGVATRLVRAYLASPLTPATEAIAAMGRVCPFFESGGMTAYEMGVDKRDARLIDALTFHRRSAWELLDKQYCNSALRVAHLKKELRSWATARRIEGDTAAIAVDAGLRLVRRPVAFAHVTEGGLMSKKIRGRVPRPKNPRGEGELPHALTFYLNADERKRVIRALRRIDENRERALVRAVAGKSR